MIQVQVTVTQLQWAGKNLRRSGLRTIDADQIVARAATDWYSVLYLRSGEKIKVQEGIDEIERRVFLTESQPDLVKRFKREMRECKAAGMSVDHAFAALWEEISAQAKLSEGEQGSLYQELLDWTKRWMK